MPYKSGYKTVYYIGEDELEKTTGLKTKTGKPVIYSELIQQYNKDNQFEDTDFPPDNSSVQAELLGFDPARGTSSYPNWDKTVVWKRPKEALELHNKTNFMKNQPIVDEIKYVFSQPSTKDSSARSRFDITQGLIADCWFVASVAQVTQSAEIIDFVVPNDNLNNNDSGCYHFRFYYFGSWVDVVVDDLLPLFEIRGPGTGYTILICAPPHENGVYEIWPLLVEKAYAKIQGSIKQLDMGRGLFGLEDLTGGIGETIDLKKFDTTALFQMLNNLNKLSFVSLGTSAVVPEGIAPRHAYCLTGLTTVNYRGQDIQLVRLRNPWGKGEWQGAWSDKSPEMDELSAEDKKKVGLVVEEDGEFWMSAEDVAKSFATLDSCNWFPEKLIPIITQAMDIQVYHGELTLWTYNENLPWSNPQYVVEVKGKEDEGCAILAHAQLKCKMQDNMQPVGVKCYQILDPNAWPDNKFSPSFFRDPTKSNEITCSCQQYYQRVTAGFKVPPGKYVITVGLPVYPPKEYGFLLTLAGQIVPTEKANSLAKQVELDDKINTDTGVTKNGKSNVLDNIPNNIDPDNLLLKADKEFDDLLKKLTVDVDIANSTAASAQNQAGLDFLEDLNKIPDLPDLNQTTADLLNIGPDDPFKVADDLQSQLDALNNLSLSAGQNSRARSTLQLLDLYKAPSYNLINPGNPLDLLTPHFLSTL